MWRWLRALADVEALTKEVAETKAKLKDTEERLFAEIDRNRSCEFAFAQTIASLSSASLPKSLPNLPSRPDIRQVVDREEPSNDEEETDFTLDFSKIDEKLVEQRAEEYIEAAKPYGGYDMTFEEVKEILRKNPKQYLTN